VRSHVSLTRLTVDTGVSPENQENRFGEFKTEANRLYETPVPGTNTIGDDSGLYFDFTAGARLSSSLRISSFCFIMILF
jgi:hypothetical protein